MTVGCQSACHSFFWWVLFVALFESAVSSAVLTQQPTSSPTAVPTAAPAVLGIEKRSFVILAAGAAAAVLIIFREVTMYACSQRASKAAARTERTMSQSHRLSVGMGQKLQIDAVGAPPGNNNPFFNPEASEQDKLEQRRRTLTSI